MPYNDDGISWASSIWRVAIISESLFIYSSLYFYIDKKPTRTISIATASIKALRLSYAFFYCRSSALPQDFLILFCWIFEYQ